MQKVQNTKSTKYNVQIVQTTKSTKSEKGRENRGKSEKRGEIGTQNVFWEGGGELVWGHSPQPGWESPCLGAKRPNPLRSLKF